MSFNRLSKFESFPVVCITIHQKKSEKMHNSVIVFYWLEIDHIEKTLNEISEYEFSIKKIIYSRQETSL